MLAAVGRESQFLPVKNPPYLAIRKSDVACRRSYHSVPTLPAVVGSNQLGIVQIRKPRIFVGEKDTVVSSPSPSEPHVPHVGQRRHIPGVAAVYGFRND